MLTYFLQAMVLFCLYFKEVILCSLVFCSFISESAFPCLHGCLFEQLCVLDDRSIVFFLQPVWAVIMNSAGVWWGGAESLGATGVFPPPRAASPTHILTASMENNMFSAYTLKKGTPCSRSPPPHYSFPTAVLLFSSFFSFDLLFRLLWGAAFIRRAAL